MRNKSSVRKRTNSKLPAGAKDGESSGSASVSLQKRGLGKTRSPILRRGRKSGRVRVGGVCVKWRVSGALTIDGLLQERPKGYEEIMPKEMAKRFIATKTVELISVETI